MTRPNEPTTVVPTEVWQTAFSVFAGHVGAEMALYRSGQPMPEIWANVFRFGCDADALKRLGIPPSPKPDPNITNEHPVEPATTSIPHKGGVR
jgi:hypothetical protein